MKNHNSWRKVSRLSWNLLVLLSILVLAVPAVPAVQAANTPDPSTVTIVGSLQTAIGCAADWDPTCTASMLAYDANADVWRGTFDLPDGNWQYKAALNASWDENYGIHANSSGDNIPLNLGSATSVKFYYDHKTNWVTDNVNSVIATAVGSFQTALGCAGDWDPSCMRSWLQDIDGDGIYTFTTTALPVGDYEGKVALNETWDLNYGAGGEQNGPNIPFSVVADGSTATFTYNSTSHVLTIDVVAPQPQHDNNIWWDGLRHDSRDLLYRTPGGAVPAGTPVILRFRTFHNDVTSVKVRLYDLNSGKQSIKSMSLAASDVDCYQDLGPYTCDFYAVTLPDDTPNNIWYRFIVQDGTKTVYYADNTPALDGGLGAPSNDVIDNSYALMVYEPGFTTPTWAENAVIYQIFPDRFRNGRSDNDPKTGDIRYDDPVLKLPWGTVPEGYCRSYTDAATDCPWRFGAPAGDSSTIEGARSRDYQGGDLKGVDQNLEYLVSLGVNTLYFNPIFDSASDHGYDTQDYFKIDPYFGTQKDWQNLVKHADKLGVRIILDGVYNHVSSDSTYFDRYQRYSTVGACESVASPYREWFTFHDVPAGTGQCAGSAGPKSATYDSWWGFDTLPVLNKSNPNVQAFFLTGDKSVARYWLVNGASGWRQDVMSDSSFPDGYWETFRNVVKAYDQGTLIIGEMWMKDSSTLRYLRGDRADTSMNYRLRDAVLGLLTPGPFDAKGFADSGRQLNISEFADRLSSIQEDYAPGTFYTLMNLLDSHDTARLLWVLTPGEATTEDKELNADNLAVGKEMQKLASLIQFTLPGAPTIYYGDEVGVTGDTDPDDRRAYPWEDKGGTPDMDMFAHYQTLADLRSENSVLSTGEMQMLLADDAAETVAYGRKNATSAAVVVVNRGSNSQTVQIPVAGFVPDGIGFSTLYAVGNAGSISPASESGMLTVELAPRSAWLLDTGEIDLIAPAIHTGLQLTEASGEINLSWDVVDGASGYDIYRSPVTGGGWVKVGSVVGPTYTDTGLNNGQTYFYAVTSLDEIGNESALSAEISGMPHMTIGWANLQWPPTIIDHVISLVNTTGNVYGQVWIDGATSQAGVTPGLKAQLGYGPQGTIPMDNPDWTWTDAVFNVDAGNNDEFKAAMLPESVGEFDYLYRYSVTGGATWYYADLNGPITGVTLPPNPGKMTVISSGDTTPPTVPQSLQVVAASPSGISLAWGASTDETAFGAYEVLRADASGGSYSMIARVTSTNYTDTAITEGETYYYVVLALDLSFNRSAHSNEVEATAVMRTVTVTINVTVPETTDATGRSVYIAGTLDRLDGGLPQWNASGVILTRVDATHWTITLTGQEGVQIEYKYTLGDWDHVEKDLACGEIGNRVLTLSYGADGTMSVNDTVLQWRNVVPCGG